MPEEIIEVQAGIFPASVLIERHRSGIVSLYTLCGHWERMGDIMGGIGFPGSKDSKKIQSERDLLWAYIEGVAKLYATELSGLEESKWSHLCPILDPMKRFKK